MAPLLRTDHYDGPRIKPVLAALIAGMLFVLFGLPIAGVRLSAPSFSAASLPDNFTSAEQVQQLQDQLHTLETSMQTLKSERDAAVEKTSAAAAAASIEPEIVENGKSEEDIEKAIQDAADYAADTTRSNFARSVFQADALTLRAILKKHNASMQEEWQTMLESQPAMGILVVAGGQISLLNAFVSLWTVRRYWNSTLPIAIMYWGESPEETTNDVTREFFYKELGQPKVQFIDASKDLPWPPHHRSLFFPGQDNERRGWALKLAAAYLAPFQQVLYIDADSAPLVAPESLFQLPDYNSMGTMFWPDAWCGRTAPYSDLIDMGLIDENDRGLPRMDEHENESGQWLLDKRKHREALEYIMLLGTHSDFGFSKAFGDKDLYRAGFVLAGKATDYTLVSVNIGFAWGPPDTKSTTESRLMRGFIQHSPAGQPLFHHRTGWQAKHDLNHPNGRPLDAISCPLPCSWTHQHHVLRYPGFLDNENLRLVDENTCPYSLAMFGSAVEECAEDFLSGKDTKVPLFSIKGSVVEQVHIAQQQGWKRVIEARQSEKKLFENEM